MTGEVLEQDVTPDILYDMSESKGSYFVRELPYSFDMAIENFMDPAHIPYAHHSLQGVRTDGTQIPMHVELDNQTHLEITFEDVVRGKSRKG